MTGTLRRFLAAHRRVLMVLLAMLAGNIGFYVLQSPLWLKTRSLRGQVAESEVQLQDALGDYGRALLEARLMEGARSQIDDLFLNTFQAEGQRYPTVDNKIKSIAAKFRLSPQSIGYTYAPLKREGLEQLQVSFALKGSYESLRQFLGEIEQARDDQDRDLFFAIERIGLNDSTETGVELNLTIAMTTYFHKPELATEWLARRANASAPRSGRAGGRS